VKVTMFFFVNTYVLRRLVVALKFLDHLDELFINCKILYLCFAFSCRTFLNTSVLLHIFIGNLAELVPGFNGAGGE